jgi:hypothetical protein
LFPLLARLRSEGQRNPKSQCQWHRPDWSRDSGEPSKSHTLAASNFNMGGVGNNWTTTAANIGPAAAGRLVKGMLVVPKNPATVTVNGLSLTDAVVDTTNQQASLWYGTVPTGSVAANIGRHLPRG